MFKRPYRRAVRVTRLSLFRTNIGHLILEDYSMIDYIIYDALCALVGKPADRVPRSIVIACATIAIEEAPSHHHLKQLSSCERLCTTFGQLLDLYVLPLLLIFYYSIDQK